MADNTKIEWTDATWNPITGCSIVSPGCTRCYAMKLAGTRLKHTPSRKGLTQASKAGPVWNGKVRLNEQWLDQPLRWKRPRRIFVCAHGDLFAEGVPDEWIDCVFAVMALAPQHTFQVLTKRAKRMREYFNHDDGFGRWGYIEHHARKLMKAPTGLTLACWGEQNLPNVWLGISAEDQARADERVPDLLATPAAVRFVSAEPLLAPIDFTRIDDGSVGTINALTMEKPTVFPDGSKFMYGRSSSTGAKLDWIIVGGESGKDARPMHPDWARSIRDRCKAAGVAFFFKQWGEWAVSMESGAGGPTTWLFHDASARPIRNAEYWPDGGLPIARVGKKRAGRLLDGVDHNDFPETR